jgi:2-dehydro-3-deoxy-D-arabinonate dehydratase
MQLCKFRRQDGTAGFGILDGGRIAVVDAAKPNAPQSLSHLLTATDPAAAAKSALGAESLTLADVSLQAPVDRQEVWAAGVTYKRSREARERESEGAAKFYDLVYSADRPEIFFKALGHRVVGPNGLVHIRRDARWSVPEPELALVVSPSLKIVGYTIGNDMSSRDIEGENPLYLPQAKVYDNSCALGPVITLAGFLPVPEQVVIDLKIERGGATVFRGSTNLAAMHRKLEDLVAWLGRENSFPDGLVLLTGTGVIPPDDFTLQSGDVVAIEITGIGRLVNQVR